MPPHPSRQPDPRKRRLIWLGLIPAMLLPTVSALGYFVLFKEASVAKPIYVATKIFTLAWPVIATLFFVPRTNHLGAWSRHNNICVQRFPGC